MGIEAENDKSGGHGLRLIGLFDISMQIAYGEGDWAFHRLMEIILQRCDEWEIFAWAGPSSGHSLRSRSPSHRDAITPSTSQTSTIETAAGRFSEKEIFIGGAGTGDQAGGAVRIASAVYFHPRSHVMERQSGKSRLGDRNSELSKCGGKKGEEIGVLVPQTEYLCFLLHARSGTLDWRKVPTSNILTTRATLLLNVTAHHDHMHYPSRGPLPAISGIFDLALVGREEALRSPAIRRPSNEQILAFDDLAGGRVRNFLQHLEFELLALIVWKSHLEPGLLSHFCGHDRCCVYECILLDTGRVHWRMGNVQGGATFNERCAILIMTRTGERLRERLCNKVVLGVTRLQYQIFAVDYSSLIHMSTSMDADIEKFPDEDDAQLGGRHETSVVDIFDEFVANNMPTHLIHIPENKVISRAALRGLAKPEDITETDITDVMESSNGYTRTRAITALIRWLLRYAILSHRWFCEGEPTYLALTSGATWEGPGYEKLRSMFRWYRDAIFPGMSGSGGWTLQELMAPRTIKFYGSNWEPLGSVERKNDREDDEVLGAVSQTTCIPIQDLKAFIPGTTRVQEKMVWASKRRTTGVEDTAYCLIGLFDISMQIAYGEGDWAFHRLMEIILQRCGEWEIFAWAGPSSGHSSSIAIPKSPRCYYTLKFSKFRDSNPPPGVSQRKKYSLAVQGLEIKLAFMRGEMTLQPDGAIRIGSPVYSNPGSHVMERRSDKFRLGDRHNELSKCSGKNGEEIGVLVPQMEYLCFLFHARSDTLDWRKVSTSNILTTRATLLSAEPITLMTLWM
ncbi:hypothetical protein BU15DRAFT_66094 [Melanogaster broomeanus]|nr:hypothetical protein BU15DRAFT_66094 [Melanogaster broomeanus]